MALLRLVTATGCQFILGAALCSVPVSRAQVSNSGDSSLTCQPSGGCSGNIGILATGTATLSDGSFSSLSDIIRVGRFGTFLLTGATTHLTSFDMSLGDSSAPGAGSVLVSNGGRLYLQRSEIYGTVTARGSGSHFNLYNFDNNYSLDKGSVLNILDGATGNVAQINGLISDGSTINVSGKGSYLRMHSSILVDDQRLTNSTINIDNGGLLDIRAGTSSNAPPKNIIANGSLISVNGANSTLQVADLIATGTNLQVLNGGLADLTGNMVQTGGRLLLAGGGTLTANTFSLTGGSGSAPATLQIGDATNGINGPGVINTRLTRSIALASTSSSRAGVVFDHTGSDYVFTHALTGNGDVAVLSGTTTLANQNSYSGTTSVTGGVLRAGAANALSRNSRYRLSGTGTLDLNGLSQDLGQVTNDGTVIVSGSASPTVVNMNAGYTGSGRLSVAGENTTLNITGPFTNVGAVEAASGAKITAAALTNNGRVMLRDTGTTLTLADGLTSNADFSVTGGAAVTTRRVTNGGTMLLSGAGSSMRLSGQYDNAGILQLEEGAGFTSGTFVNDGTVLITGSGTQLHTDTLTNNSTGLIDLNGFSRTLGDIINAGTINLTGSSAGAVLTVNGNYTGYNGLLLFGTELGDDSATSDRLIVTGDVTGTTRVRVNNLGGSGAETLNGITLIEVEGSADSSAFTQEGRIVAGAYDYRLVRGNRDWYLTNRTDLETGLPIIPDEEEGNGSGGDNGGGDGDSGSGDNSGGDNGSGSGGSSGSDGSGKGVMVLRPEGGAYAANLATASTLFDTRMNDRQGTWYLDPVTGEEKHTSLWLRTSGDHNRLNAGGGQLSTRANSSVTMLGGDVAATETARFGLMAGYGNSKSNTASTITGYRARGQVNGYTTGLYGTWFAQGTDEKGLWADSTLQYSWFNNSVDGEDEAGESYRSKGLSASLSTGYVIPLGEGARTAFFLQPQARVSWSGIKANDHTERNGTLVQGSGQDNISSSLGMKAFMKGHSQLDDNTGRQSGLFAEVNWIHNTREYVVRMDGVSVSQNGSRNIAEARVGIDGALGGGLGVKGTIGQQVGDKGWSDTAAAISISYRF